MSKVAVIGGGPAGIVVAKFLLTEGFEPVVFERGAQVGGQWTGEAGHSGVWPTLHTNTSRVLTAFSDLAQPSAAVFPSNAQVRSYIEEYARQFGVLERVRCNTPVRRLRRSGLGWSVELDGGTEEFERVVVATGRFHSPFVPDVKGLESFTGSCGVTSTYDYKEPDKYRAQRVLVAGCAVSALEIAADLAALGAASVAITQRRQRYVLPKFAAGVPSDHCIFTRYATLANESLDRAEVGRQLKEIVVEASGSPEQYGAPKPDDDFFTAGVTLNQQYLALVAEGRIAVHSWIDHVEGSRVTFQDGTHDEYDAIIFGTGFDLSIPFLDDEIRDILDLDTEHADLYRHTFHPDLPGLAFLGMWDQSGGYFVPIELQARWVAYTWSGAVPAPSTEDLREGIAEYRARRGQSQKTRMNLIALEFARAAGVEPDLAKHPSLQRALLFGPLAPVSFRLDGHDTLADAEERFSREAQAFGCIISDELSPRERSYLQMVAEARSDETLHAIAGTSPAGR